MPSISDTLLQHKVLREARRKKKKVTFYKTLFKPKLQVPFVIQTPFVILLERPLLIKAAS